MRAAPVRQRHLDPARALKRLLAFVLVGLLLVLLVFVARGFLLYHDALAETSLESHRR